MESHADGFAMLLRSPERLLRALVLQMLYSVRSERMLMEQLDYNMVRMRRLLPT